MHQISVIGNTDEILHALNLPDDIELEISNKKVTFMSESMNAIDNIKKKLHKIIFKIIREKYCRKLINDIFKSTDYCFSDTEKAAFEKELSHGDTIIDKKLAEFLPDAACISIEGFVKFRLREYSDFLKKRMSIYDDKISSVREIDDLLKLLQIYVSTKSSTEELIQIFILSSGGYILKNHRGDDITERCIRDFISYKSFKEMSFDDILLSCLILSAPKEIIIHCNKSVKNSEVITVIEKIFGGGVSYCNGCLQCDKI